MYAKILVLILSVTLLTLTSSLLPPQEVHARSLAQAATPSPAELIQAVNALRLSNGLPPLNTHPILMQVAQWEVGEIASGAPGHTRPAGLTLGQWLLSLGYPLSGDLSLDGYRSENFVLGPDLTVQGAVQMWLGDDPHTNTMLSPNRSDIGAGVASRMDEWGSTVYFYVLETALQTSSGKMQSDAYPVLTAIPVTQVALYGDATQAAQALLVPQYMIPVARNTARPDGDVIHEVQYGQTMWSIAIEYGVKIEQIRQLNNLSSTEIYPGQKLLVQKGATQPALQVTHTATPTALGSALSPTPVAEQNGPLPPSASPPAASPPEKTSVTGMVVGIALLVLLLAGLFSHYAAQRAI